jgi:transcription antitermination protein NusB
MSRNKARVVAMQALFQIDDDREAIRPVIDSRAAEEQLAEKDLEYVDLVVGSVIENQKKVDDYISKYSIDWDIDRLGKVERAILRLAMGEMLFVDDVPVSVSINEAVLLAKKYGADQASKFLNGILGRFSREVLGEERKKL